MKSDVLAVQPLDQSNPIPSLDGRVEKTIQDLTVGVPAEAVGATAMSIRAAFVAGFVSRDEVSQEIANQWVAHFINDAPRWIQADLVRGASIVDRNTLKNQ